MLKIKSQAPDFSHATIYQKGAGEEGFKKISLSDYRDKWLVLFFYPRDFTFVCPTEIKEFQKLQQEFGSCGCGIVACSTDSKWAHKNWFERDLPEVSYPIIADTSQEIARAYEVLGKDGEADRGVFIISPEGTIEWLMISGNSVGRSVKEILRALKALQSGDLCPVESETGEKTLGKA